MNRKAVSISATVIIVVCIAYIAYDIATGRSDRREVASAGQTEPEPVTDWIITKSIPFTGGKLTSVHTSADGRIIVAGEGFITGYDAELNTLWSNPVSDTIWALASDAERIYAATREQLLVLGPDGTETDRWGPWDDGAIITSVAANNKHIAIADAGNLLVFIIDKQGALVSMAGHPGNQFIVPSPYFDVWLTEDDTLLVANTGTRSIEFRSIKGELVRSIGEEGDDWDEFCGCCNPSHFTLTADGKIVTAEKGINRLKIITQSGSLVEAVAQPAGFARPVPVDIAITSEGKLYAANSFDSKLYIFEKIN